MDAGIAPSVGSQGDAYDNALAESVIGVYKTEVIRRKGPWRTLEAVEFATLTWVDWFNTRRLLGPLGDIPPAEFEAQYYEQAEVELGRGLRTPEMCKKLGISEQTYYRWRKEYGGLRLDQAKRLKELERENGRLKKLVADQALDNMILKEVASGNF